MIYKYQYIISQFAAAVSIFVFAGCSVTEIKTISSDEDIRHLEKGYELFCQGDYENAAEQFEIICQGSGTVHIRQEALYSLACTRMILAEDQENFLHALDLWTVWNRQGILCPKFMPGENPRMFGPFLEKLYEGSEICCSESEETPDMAGDLSTEFSADPAEDKSDPQEDRDSDADISSVKTRTAEKNAIAALRNSEKKMKLQIQKKDREILHLKEQMRKMKKEMDTLRTQLNSLEEIHQEIQEKKKDMVSP